MEEQQKTQHLGFEKNGKHLQPSLPIYSSALAYNHNQSDSDLDLRSLLTVMRRRAVTIGSVAIALAATIGLWTVTRQPKYEGNFRLLVEPVTTESQLEGLTQIPGATNSLPQESLDYDTQIQVLQSPELMHPIVEELSQLYPDIDYKSMLEDMKIERFEKTKILEVRYLDTQPEKIQFVLQQLAKEYLKYSLQERQTKLRQGINFVDAQLPELEVRVNNLQKQLEQFRQQYKFIDPEVKAEQLAEQVDEIQLQRLDTEKELAENRALYANFRNQTGAALADNPDFYLANSNSSQERSDTTQALKEAPVYQKLVSQLRDIESQIGADATRFQNDSPNMIMLRKKRENLLPVLRTEAQRVLGNKLVELSTNIAKLEVRLAQIARTENELKREVGQLPTLARQYTDVQRELKIATESLNRFLEKRESLQVENAQNEIPWQIIAAPKVEEDPVSPNIKRNLILGAIAGIIAGIGAALLTERLDNVFHSPEDLKDLTKLPLLGAIPFNKGLKQLTPLTQAKVEKKVDGYKLVLPNINNQQNESYFPFVEAFRSLHTNINFLGSDTPIRSLVVSSAEKGDGKSTVAVQLAQAAASMGQRVLIVDADMRLPQVHSRLNLPNEQGLSNIISTNLPTYEVIQRSLISDNLFAITSGQIPPDPIKLLSSKKMLNIMAELRQEFDLVIYDTPPILGLADSSIIANHTDGIIVVVRMAKTDRSVVKQALDGLKLSRANVLGTVVNGVKKHSSSSYNYYYYKGKTSHANSN